MGRETAMLKGKYLSILGDSVSTYNGVSNDGSANAALYANRVYYFSRHFPVESTYWHIILREYGMRLCVNNSFSGGELSGKDNPFSGVSRSRHLSRDSGESPDVIIVFMGLNDLGRGVDAEIFRSDYEATLSTIARDHPLARVFCVNMPNRPNFLTERTKIINSVIEGAVEAAGDNFFLVRLYDHVFKDYDEFYMNTVDGLHPDPDGMKIIAEAIRTAIDKSL